MTLPTSSLPRFHHRGARPLHMQTSTPNTRHDYTKRLWDCVSAAFWDCALLGPARSCWSLHLLLVLRLLLCACPALTVLLLAPRIHPVVILCTNPFFPCSARLARQGSNSIDERHDKVQGTYTRSRLTTRSSILQLLVPSAAAFLVACHAVLVRAPAVAVHLRGPASGTGLPTLLPVS